MFISTIREDISFLTYTFLIPLIAAYNLLHNNPFDIELGTLDANAFENYLFELRDKKTSFTLVCIYLESTKNKEYIKAIRNELNTTYSKILERSYLFKINDNKFVLILKNGKIVAQNYESLQATLDKIYDKFTVYYKLTIIPSCEVLNNTKNYIKLNKFLESRMQNNSIYFCTQDDVNLFMKDSYIIEQLHDIVKKNDLDDQRVLVYCQPVYNITEQKYDSAEALMRLKLPELGMIFPDQFIPLAEKEKSIHVLSKIILNKTCKFIKECKENNLDIKRISVNFSILELKDKDFCTDIINIINLNGVSFNNIAIELTESKTEHDFNIIKEKVEELKKLGMYFYLDDFGTGYSNLDRIMQLPIDIIKFDRSLVLLSGKDSRYHHTIRGFSTTFEELGYEILFEGIENKEDEDMCINMNAQYLQGYKYSRPMPIKELKNFINKN
jgi:EAL domain-containing protein (putative c-di-GMP-specific phosphodiesterase class I)